MAKDVRSVIIDTTGDMAATVVGEVSDMVDGDPDTYEKKMGTRMEYCCTRNACHGKRFYMTS